MKRLEKFKNLKVVLNLKDERSKKLDQSQCIMGQAQEGSKIKRSNIFKCETIHNQYKNQQSTKKIFDSNDSMKEQRKSIIEDENDDALIPNNIAKPKPVYGQMKFQIMIDDSILKKSFSDYLIQKENNNDPLCFLNKNKNEQISPNLFNMTDASNYRDSFSNSKMNSTNYLKSKNYRKYFRDILLKPSQDFCLNINSNLNSSISNINKSSQNIFPLSASPLPSLGDQLLVCKTESSKTIEDFYQLVNKEYQDSFLNTNLLLKNPILTLKDDYSFNPKV